MGNVIGLINEILAKDITFQFLHECMLSSSDLKKAGHTKVSFATDVTTSKLCDPKGKTAIILWVDKTKMSKAIKQVNKKAKVVKKNVKRNK